MPHHRGHGRQGEEGPGEGRLLQERHAHLPQPPQDPLQPKVQVNLLTVTEQEENFNLKKYEKL